MPHERVIICGSGPAGLTAALYAARANLSPFVLEGLQPGGQLTTTTDVDNFPGFPQGIMGPELIEAMHAQAERFGARFEFDAVVSCDLSRRPFTLTTDLGLELTCDALIIATGATAKYLGLPNEERLRGKGVSACATCDGFFFKDVEVAVVGGGDTAMEEALFLTKFATRVHLLVRRDVLRASKVMQARVRAHERIQIHWHTEVDDVLGAKDVTGLRLRDNRTGETRELPVGGLFLAIGHEPASGPFRPFLDHDAVGYLKTLPGRAATNVPGVFACGDVQDSHYRQAVTAAGTGCMAAIECERWLEAGE